MPNLDNIAGLINSALQADQFNHRRFQAASWFTVADKVVTKTETEEVTKYAIFDNNGEGSSVTFDDTNTLQVFHIVESVSYKIADPDYGPPGTTMEETADMRFVFIGKRSKIEARPENVMAACVADFPKEFLNAIVSPLGMNSCVIEMGNVETDPYTVWANLYSGVEFNLSTDTILFSINYKIVSTFNKKCFTLCQ